jgi:hypothetical protein
VRVEGSGSDDDDVFEVSPSADTAAAEPEYQGANVCRVAALSTMLGGDRRSVRGLEAPLSDLGFPDGLSSGEQVWSDLDPMDSFAGLRDQRFGGDTPGGDRVSRWQTIQETAEPQAAIAFLVAVLGSPLEQESAAAAAALWRQVSEIDSRRLLRGRPWPLLWDRLYDVLGPEWDEPAWWGVPWAQPGILDVDTDTEDSTEVPWEPGTWIAIYQRGISLLGDRYRDIWLIALLVRWRLSRAMRSPDLITRSLAQAALWPAPGVAAILPPAAPPATPPTAVLVSTMIHGTWAWAGDWWEPGGEFHNFIRDNHRSNLYNGGAPFSWSGVYRPGHRKRGAERLSKWSGALAPDGFQTVFAHSYGGDVAAGAVAIHRTRVDELVLLSAPATEYVEAAARTNMHIVDVRLYLDPVLGLARRWQRIEKRSNVTEVVFKKWRLDHGATHRDRVWRKEDVARRGGI